MERRDFLRRVGLGGLAVAAAPAIALPMLKPTALAQPERKFFLPPQDGWTPAREVITSSESRGLSLDDYAEHLEVSISSYDLDVQGLRPGMVARITDSPYGDCVFMVTDVSIDCPWDGPVRASIRGVGMNDVYPWMAATPDPVAIKNPTEWSVRRSLRSRLYESAYLVSP